MANTVDKVLAIAEAEVGYLEKASGKNLDSKTANAGKANYTKYGKEMHDLCPTVMDYPAAWCDAFVDWLFYKAFGESAAKKLLGGDFNDYTPFSVNLYKSKGRYYTSNPKVGDQIFFKNASGVVCHTGIVYKVDASKVYTIEGNTSGASGVIANGGGVRKKSYSLNYNRIHGYGRPAYDNVDITASTTEKKEPVKAVLTTNALREVNDVLLHTLKNGSKGNSVKALQILLIGNGYSCGSCGADGDFGSATLAAVKKFQKANGLSVDGIVGAKTWTALLK